MSDKSKHEVIVYSTSACSHCVLAKAFLKENNIEFEEIDLSADRKKAMEVVKRSGQTSVPQIEIDGEIIVGFDKDKLKKKLGL